MQSYKKFLRFLTIRRGGPADCRSRSKILEDLSESVPTLKEKVPTNLMMKQKDALKKESKVAETDLNGNVLLPRFKYERFTFITAETN